MAATTQSVLRLHPGHIEISVILPLAVHNLNRDDTGAPKTCMVGATERSRISSQCPKQAWRHADVLAHELATANPDTDTIRTRHIEAAVVNGLPGSADDEAVTESNHIVAATVVRALGIKPCDKNASLTSYLLFIETRNIDQLVGIAREHYDVLLENGKAYDAAQRNAEGGNGKKASKEAAKSAPALPREIAQQIHQVIGRVTRSVPIALCGRFVADRHDASIDAAMQVSHAFTTHATEVDADFFTACDDFSDGDQGAGMLGLIEFTGGVYNSYININIGQALQNLDGNVALVRAGVRGYLRAICTVLPKGKQNSFPTHSRPALVLITMVDRHPLNDHRSYQDAFEKPVDPHDGSLTHASIRRLLERRGQLNRKIALRRDPDGNPCHEFLFVLDDTHIEGAQVADLDVVDTLDDLVNRTDERLSSWLEAV